MAVITSRTSLSQGAKTSESVAFTASSGQDTTLTGTSLPGPMVAGDFFEIRNSPITNNNGLYIATGSPSTSNVPCTKVNGAGPTDDTSETVDWLGDVSDYKSVFFDTAGLGIYLLEKGNLSVDGVIGQAIYSFSMEEWKDDDFLIANAPFPMFMIDSDAGKLIVGQDASGNNNGWNWVDNGTHSIRTRKLLRNVGWDEVDVNGNTISRKVGVTTLGVFEAPTTDLAYYFFGDDTTVDNSTDFDFAGPVNEAVEFFVEIGNPATCDFATSSTITRASGSFITDGFVKGGQVTVRNADNAAHNGTYVLTAVAALTLTVTGTPFTGPDPDTNAILAVNNDNAFTLALRVRDGDPKGKTFGQANLASAGKTALGNFVYAFPLANATDQNIDVIDTGIDVDSNGTPDVGVFAGMSITYHSTPQARSQPVGGPFNYGIIIEGNNGTAQQIYEFVQWSLRSTGGNGTGDIDADADTAIGRMMDGLMRFNGSTLEAGSPDGGLSYPNNPDGGGSGVFIDNINASSANNVKFFDNTQPATPIGLPETIAVTNDFNGVLEGDAQAIFGLYYDRTIRDSIADFALTTTAGGTMTGTLPNNTEVAVGSYIRVSGLTAGDAAMNGVYQIVTETTPGSSWVVTRYDSTTIVAVSATTANLDQFTIDAPDAKLVHTNVTVTDTTIATVEGGANDTITDSNSGFGVFAAGDYIEVEGTAADDGIYLVDTAVAGTLTLNDAHDLVGEVAGSSITITKVAKALINAADTFVFSYDFDGNSQGGRPTSPAGDTFVKGKAIGFNTAQYTESTVQTISSGTPLTIPYVSQTERNTA